MNLHSRVLQDSIQGTLSSQNSAHNDSYTDRYRLQKKGRTSEPMHEVKLFDSKMRAKEDGKSEKGISTQRSDKDKLSSYGQVSKESPYFKISNQKACSGAY